LHRVVVRDRERVAVGLPGVEVEHRLGARRAARGGRGCYKASRLWGRQSCVLARIDERESTLVGSLAGGVHSPLALSPSGSSSSDWMPRAFMPSAMNDSKTSYRIEKQDGSNRHYAVPIRHCCDPFFV
jgi:hypothetical protein